MNYLVDPEQVIDYDRNDAELELFWLFSCVVAGKTAKVQAKLLDQFLSSHPGETPFDTIRGLVAKGRLMSALVDSRIGQYGRLARMFEESLALDLRTCTVTDLEGIYGCGPKTARMFIMMSRRGQRLAALDTHVLKHLNANGIDAPKTTPPAGNRYAELEMRFIALADAADMPVAEYDLMVWKEYAQ